MQKYSSDKHYCYVCGREMEFHHKIQYADYVCKCVEDHHFSYRVMDDKMTKLRVRFTREEDGSALRLKIHYDLGYSEIWSVYNSAQRIKINHIIVPDFTDLPKLKNKIKTYLLFG